MSNQARVLGSLLGVWASSFLVSCASAPRVPIARVASADLACDQVQVDEVADNRFQANGCGRTGTYAELCSGRHCSWVRIRSSAEAQGATAGGSAPVYTSYGAQQVASAPPPAQREVIAAPSSAQAQPREVIQAPPPETQAAAAPAGDAQTATASPAPQQQNLQPYTPQATPLAQGDLSQPYQTEVPAQPVAQRVEYPPPAPLVETRPPPPQPNYTWISGYWWWNNPRWLWAPGYWCAPRFGYSYVPSSWYFSSGYWWFGPGGWARPGSTLVVAHVGPRPNRWVYSRSFTPRAIATGPGGRMGTGPAYGPSRSFTPQGSPLYRYPTSSSARAGRMSATRGDTGSAYRGNFQSGPSRMGGGTVGPSRFGAGPQRFGTSSSPSFGSGRSSSDFRSGPMMRGPSGGGGSSFRGGGGGFGRMGGGGGFGGGGGGVGRMGGGPSRGGGGMGRR